MPTAIEYKIVHDPDREGRGVQCLTFTVNGEPSMKWFHKCGVEGLPEDHYVTRCIDRLKAGRSREVTGGPVVGMTSGGDSKLLAEQKGRGRVFPEDTKPTETETGSGKRVKRSGTVYRYELDGEKSKETYPTEAKAKEALAVKAFMSRGKLGRLEEAQGAFTAFCKENKLGKGEVFVCPERHRVLARDKDGTEYVVGFGRDEVSFKPLAEEANGRGD